jgi:hypothetical protein
MARHQFENLAIAGQSRRPIPIGAAGFGLGQQGRQARGICLRQIFQALSGGPGLAELMKQPHPGRHKGRRSGLKLPESLLQVAELLCLVGLQDQFVGLSWQGVHKMCPCPWRSFPALMVRNDCCEST